MTWEEKPCDTLASAGVEDRSERPAGGRGDEQQPGTDSTRTHQKSAMSLLNELTRFHGIKHEYKLCEESGPPHDRKFHVELRIGEKEAFRGVGRSIRKAQHSAAQAALDNTALAAPASRARKTLPRKSPCDTPTVELNVLAMKRCLSVRYDVTDPQTILPFPQFDPPAALLYDYRANPHQRHHFKKTPYTAVLRVGDMVFEGSGMTPQGARHCSAEKALHALRAADPQTELVTGGPDNKSPVSLVHEMAAKIDAAVRFELVSESGPGHLPCFVIRCFVSGYACEGEGNSKKVAKKKAADQMVQKLRSLPALTGEQGSKSKPMATEKPGLHQPDSSPAEKLESQNEEVSPGLESTRFTLTPVRELISPSTSISEDDKDNPVHPVNQLSRMVRALRKEEPTYLVIYERCLNKKRKEFVVECAVKDPGAAILTAVGIDAHRKVAKKKAAAAMIQLILTGRSSPEIVLPPKSLNPPILKDSQNKPAGNRNGRERKVSFTDKSSHTYKRGIAKGKPESSRTTAPGVLLVSQ